MEFKKDDQVIVRKQIRTGKLVRMGSIVRMDGDKALVQFPIDHLMTVVPVSQLEKTSTAFGNSYVRIQPSANQRGVLSPRFLRR